MLFLNLLLLIKLTVSVRRWNTSELTSTKNMVVASKMLRKTPVKLNFNIADGEKYLSRLPSNPKNISSDLAIFRSIYVARFMDINNIKQEKLSLEILAKFYRNHLNFLKSNLDERPTRENIYFGGKQLRNKQLKYHIDINDHFHGIRSVKQPNKQTIEYFLTKYSQYHANRVQAYYKTYNWVFQICSIEDLKFMENIVRYMLDFDFILKKGHNFNSDPKISTELPSLEEALPDNTSDFLVQESKEKIKPPEYSKTNMTSESTEHIRITGSRVFVDATGTKQLREHTALNIIEVSTSNNIHHIASPNPPVYSPGTTNELSTEKNSRPSSFSFVTRLPSLSKPIHHISLQINKRHALMFPNGHSAVLTSNKKQLISTLRNKIILRKLLAILFQKELLKFKETQFITKCNYKVILFPMYPSQVSNILIRLAFQSKYIHILLVICRSNHDRRRLKQFRFIQCRFSVILLFRHSGLKGSRIKCLEKTLSSFTGRNLLFRAESSNSALIRRLIKRDLSSLKSSQQLSSLKLKQSFSTMSNDQTTTALITSSLIHSSSVVTSIESTTQLRSPKEPLSRFSNVTETPKESVDFVNSSTVNLTQTVDSNKTFNVVDIVIQPAILLTGIIGNIISILVFRSKDFKNEVALYIPVFMSIVEMFTGIIVFFDSAFYIYSFGGKVSTLNVYMCKIFHYLKVFVKSTSSWTVAFMSTERFIVVWFPFKANIYITKYKVLSALAVCCLVEVIFSFFQINMKSYEHGLCVQSQESHILVVMITLFNGWLIPSLTIVILNILIIIQLRRQNRIRNSLSNDDRNQQSRQINLMLFTIIICKFIFDLPGMVQHVFQWVHFKPSNILASIFIALGIVQHSVNAFLYSFVSSTFRSVILNCFRSKS